MNLHQALKRLSYTIGNGHKCNDKDIDAFNGIVEWIEREKEQRLFYNHHFAKVSLWVYNQLLLHYKGDNNTAEKELQRILEAPLQHQYEIFKRHMDMFSLNSFFEHIGVKNDNELKTLEGLRQEYKNNKEIFEQPETAKLFKEHLEMGMYTESEIVKKLNFFLTELLNKYENKEHDLQWLEKYLNKNNEQ